jgi:hypothetical protein
MRYADDVDDFGYRLFMIIDEINDFAIHRRKAREALSQKPSTKVVSAKTCARSCVDWARLR